jgi:hypothetical protein
MMFEVIFHNPERRASFFPPPLVGGGKSAERSETILGEGYIAIFPSPDPFARSARPACPLPRGEGGLVRR